jgi:hypothetical protein
MSEEKKSRVLLRKMLIVACYVAMNGICMGMAHLVLRGYRSMYNVAPIEFGMEYTAELLFYIPPFLVLGTFAIMHIFRHAMSINSPSGKMLFLLMVYLTVIPMTTLVNSYYGMLSFLSFFSIAVAMFLIYFPRICKSMLRVGNRASQHMCLCIFVLDLLLVHYLNGLDLGDFSIIISNCFIVQLALSMLVSALLLPIIKTHETRTAERISGKERVLNIFSITVMTSLVVPLFFFHQQPKFLPPLHMLYFCMFFEHFSAQVEGGSSACAAWKSFLWALSASAPFLVAALKAYFWTDINRSA